MEKIILEVCCGSADDVIQAQRGGADRVELNMDLFHGGLTASIGTMMTARAAVDIPIMAMVRPREGGFCYTQAEFQTMLADARELLNHGADGIVFGFLNEDGTIDARRCEEMLAVIGDHPSVFHRAIDVVPDWRAAIDLLAGLGVTRILTSGQAPNVYFALDRVREMIEHAAGRVEILPGAGVSMDNAAQIVAHTGCTQLHMGRHQVCYDLSTANHRDIFYGGALYPPEDRYLMIDPDYIRDFRAQVE